MKRMLLTAALVVWGLAPAAGAEAVRQAADEAVIRKAVESYVASFNKGDAKALAALWSSAAVYTNPLSEEQVVGREAIEKEFAGIFANAKGARLEAKTDTIQFISPSVAVEYGTAKVTLPDQAPEETEYTAVYVKHETQWLLDRVTEKETPVVPSHYEQLKCLEWMTGRWVDQDDEATVVTECAEQELPDPFLHRPDPRPHRHGRDADNRLGPGDQADSLMGLRFGRRLRPGGVEEEGHSLVHPAKRSPARRAEVLFREHHHLRG